MQPNGARNGISYTVDNQGTAESSLQMFWIYESETRCCNRDPESVTGL
jgi:subtilase family serine protease